MDERIVWSARIQPVCPLGRPGRRTCTQRLPSLPLTAPITGSTVRDLRQRPHGGDGLDHARLPVGRRVGDVILQQDHERLGHGHLGVGRDRGCGQGRSAMPAIATASGMRAARLIL